MRKITAQEVFEEVEFQMNRLTKEKVKNATATSKVDRVKPILEGHRKAKA